MSDAYQQRKEVWRRREARLAFEASVKAAAGAGVTVAYCGDAEALREQQAFWRRVAGSRCRRPTPHELSAMFEALRRMDDAPALLIQREEEVGVARLSSAAALRFLLSGWNLRESDFGLLLPDSASGLHIALEYIRDSGERVPGGEVQVVAWGEFEGVLEQADARCAKRRPASGDSREPL